MFFLSRRDKKEVMAKLAKLDNRDKLDSMESHLKEMSQTLKEMNAKFDGLINALTK